MTAKTGQDLIDEAKRQIDEVTPEQVRDMQARNESVVYLDVREPNEWNIAHLDGAKLLPVNSITQRASELDTASEMVIYCKTGIRSARALNELRGLGFRKLWNLKGGITAWAEEVDSSMPVY